MFLEPQLTCLTGMGYLVIKLHDPIELSFRYSSWNNGLELELWDNGSWQIENVDFGIPLITAALSSSDKSPLASFIDTIPESIREAVQPYQYCQTLLLQWIARNKSFQELFSHTPTLAWLIIVSSHQHEWSPEEVENLLYLPRHQILDALNGNGTRSLVKLLGRVQLRNYDLAEYNAILTGLGKADVLKQVSGWKKIPVSLLFVLGFFEATLHSNILKSIAVAPYHDLSDLIAKCRVWFRYRRDALTVGHVLGIQDADAALSRCSTLEGIKAIHDRWTDRLNQQNCIARYGRTQFPQPPLAGNKQIHPIRTLEDLQEEGRLMHHCVASHAYSVMQGNSYIYRILEPQRATIEIGMRNGELAVREVSLAFNRQPNEATFSCIFRWLNQGREKTLNSLTKGEHSSQQ